MRLGSFRRLISAALIGGVLLSIVGCSPLRRWAYEGIGRDDWQQPERVLAELPVVAGQSVADVGAGGGYFTWHLADAVGPTGHVYAVDVDRDMVEYIDAEVDDRRLENVSTVLAAFEDPKIPAPVDLIFSCNTYHHIENRVAYFRNAKRYLKPGGRVAIIDLLIHGNFLRRWFLSGHSTPPEQILSEFEQAGYALQARHDFVEQQSFFVFSPKPG